MAVAGVFFLLDLVLLGAAGLLALAGCIFFGGAQRAGAARRTMRTGSALNDWW